MAKALVTLCLIGRVNTAFVGDTTEIVLETVALRRAVSQLGINNSTSVFSKPSGTVANKR